MAWGSSLRGLSSVTITRIGQRGGDLAHDRPLALVAIAAAAEHAYEAPGANGRSALQGGRQRIGLVRVVDDGEARRARCP